MKTKKNNNVTDVKSKRFTKRLSSLVKHYVVRNINQCLFNGDLDSCEKFLLRFKDEYSGFDSLYIVESIEQVNIINYE